MIDIKELEDYKGTLGNLKQIVDTLVQDFGPNATVNFDAGYNNVSVYLTLVESHKPL